MQKLSFSYQTPDPAWILGTEREGVKERIAFWFCCYAVLFLMNTQPHVAVVGAGAFGGWTALHLCERGARVTLLDAWGPGNSRSSSGGETRVMRGTYGPDQPYTEMAARALQLWAKYERKWNWQFLYRSGMLWMASSRNDAFERGSVDMLRASRINHQELSRAEMRKRWPQLNLRGIGWGIFEPECGYLDARASCAAVLEAFVAGGGEYRQAEVSPAGLATLLPRGLVLRDRHRPRLKADLYIFACGPWMGTMFAVLRNLIRSTKQDVYFFGPPMREAAYFTDAHLPVWADHGDHFFYGVPGSDRRGFKIADDTRGPDFDPTNGERIVNPETLKRIRAYLAFRFPALKDAPLVETRVCQYEQTPDSHFIVDRLPANENVWLLGGGSGHGFKHGPAIGEMMADLVLKDREPAAIWRLERFKKTTNSEV
jgi:glycine/D-amino acid oxidase-like deaminating enzyme